MNSTALWILLAILILALIALVILAFIFWILMLIDCAKRKFETDGEKIVWILVVILLGILGAVIYYFAVKKPSRKLAKKRR